MTQSSKISQFYYKNNRLQQIRGFCNTVAYGSVTKASEIMSLSQSTISLQIKTLERDLKKQLLKRDKKNSKKFSLTEDGKEFYEMALPILISTDELCERFLSDRLSHQNSFLKIAGHHSVFSIIINKSLAKIKNKNPDLNLELSYLTRLEGVNKVINDEVDIAIYPVENIETLPKNLEYQKVADYKPALILPLNHPLEKLPNKKITFEEIGKYNYIHTGSYAISDIMKYNIASKILKSDIELNYGSWDILRSLVAVGLGVTILHEDYCKGQKDIVIKNVSHLSPKIAYYAIFKKGSKPKKLVSDLIDLISSQE
jgi:DNA-binding transcriptional LysR family regulator